MVQGIFGRALYVKRDKDEKWIDPWKWIEMAVVKFILDQWDHVGRKSEEIYG